MVVVDIDSHWELARDGLDPDERVTVFAEVLAGDLYREVPRDQWPAIEQLVPPAVVEMFRNPGVDPTPSSPGAHDIPGRLAWCDHIGIDFQFVNGGGLTGLEFTIEDLAARRAVLRAANDRLLDALDGHSDRFSPIVTIDATDVDLAIAEITRCRSRGSRAYSLRAQPPGGVSYTHPQFDRLWAATVDLGMVAYLHIGNAPAYFDAGWANLGLEHKGAAGRSEAVRLSNMARMQAGETMLAAMVYGGVFDRHPNLTIFVAELWAGWIPFLAYRLGQHTRHDTDINPVMGAWPYEVSGADMLRRNVRVTVLPHADEDAATIEREPGMLAFSSDYPHREGSATPIDELAPVLDRLDPDARAWYMGENILEVFERMGDPLPVAPAPHPA